MQDLSDGDRKGILGEVLMDELKAIREGIADLPTRREFNEVKENVEHLTSDMTVVKVILRDHERDIKRLKAKIA